MASGSAKRLGKRDRARVDTAVASAEAATGLQFCVFLGAVDDADPRAHAERMFASAGLGDRPALLIVVAPVQRRVEIVTASDTRARVSDEDSASAIATMAEWLTRGDLAGGLIAGVEHLAACAGPGAATSAAELPNVIQE